MNKTSPKVSAAGVTALVTALLVSLVLHYAPVLAGHSAVVSDVVTAVVTAAAAYAVGWYRKAVDWATVYVQEHQASSEGFVPGTPE